MEVSSPRGPRARLRWTLGSLMVVVAAFAFVFAVARPFMTPAPKSGDVIGIDFVVQATRLPDGRVVSGLAPKIVVSRSDPGRSRP